MSPDYPLLRASPDRSVYDCSEPITFGFVEVKCPYKHRYITPAEACSDPSFCSRLVMCNGTEQLTLKESHPYCYTYTVRSNCPEFDRLHVRNWLLPVFVKREEEEAFDKEEIYKDLNSNCIGLEGDSASDSEAASRALSPRTEVYGEVRIIISKVLQLPSFYILPVTAAWDSTQIVDSCIPPALVS